MTEPTQEKWAAMTWNEKATSRINNHHDRIQELEKRLDKLNKAPSRRTVDDLAGNNRKLVSSNDGNT